MPKRKSKATPNGDVSDSDSDTSLLNVDFDFFPPHERDYHGLKSLLTQLLHTSSKSLPVNELADAIIDQPVLGTCVKCEDEEHTAEENDPFAFLACVDLWDRREEAGTKRTVEWLRRKCEGEKGLEGVRGLLEGMREERRVGLVLAERLINMPPAVAPALWRLLLEELNSAAADDPYQFTHFILLSKTYVEVDSALPDMDIDSDEEAPPKSRKSNHSNKKATKTARTAGADTLYFHPEDEVLLRHSSASGSFRYDNEEDASADSKRAFADAGIRPRGLVAVLERDKLPDAVREVGRYIEGTTGEG